MVLSITANLYAASFLSISAIIPFSLFVWLIKSSSFCWIWALILFCVAWSFAILAASNAPLLVLFLIALIRLATLNDLFSRTPISVWISIDCFCAFNLCCSKSCICWSTSFLVKASLIISWLYFLVASNASSIFKNLAKSPPYCEIVEAAAPAKPPKSSRISYICLDTSNSRCNAGKPSSKAILAAFSKSFSFSSCFSNLVWFSVNFIPFWAFNACSCINVFSLPIRNSYSLVWAFNLPSVFCIFSRLSWFISRVCCFFLKCLSSKSIIPRWK